MGEARVALGHGRKHERQRCRPSVSNGVPLPRRVVPHVTRSDRNRRLRTGLVEEDGDAFTRDEVGEFLGLVMPMDRKRAPDAKGELGKARSRVRVGLCVDEDLKLAVNVTMEVLIADWKENT